MRANRLRRGRALRVAAALGLIGLAVAVPRAYGAADDDFVTVSPMGQIFDPDSVADVLVDVTTPDVPSTITITVNGYQAADPYHETGTSHSFPADLHCAANNVVKVDVAYDGGSPAPMSQTVSGVVLLCPQLVVSPVKVVGEGPLTLKLTRWDGDGGYDSLEPYTRDEPAKAKRLYLDNTLMGTFGYRIAPTLTDNVTCGSHTVKLVQDTRYGTLEASGPFEVWCSTWQVSPNGLIAPTGSHDITISDPTTDYRANTTVAVTVSEPYNNGEKSFGTFTFPEGGKLSQTFSDDGYLACDSDGHSAGGDNTVNLHIVQPDPPPPPPPPPPRLRFAPLGFAPQLAPVVTDEHIPFHVLCPWVDPYFYVDGLIDQSALPYELPVEMGGYDDDTNAYDARDIQPLTFRLDDVVLGTGSYDSLGENVFKAVVNPSCGEHTYTATQPTGLGLATAHFTFSILCPRLTLDPTPITGRAQPQVIDVQGTSFHPPWLTEGPPVPQQYVLRVDGKQVDAGVTDDDGALENAFTASDLGCGVHDVTVTELPSFGRGGARNVKAPDAAPTDPQAPLSASAPLTVNCPTVPPPNGHPGTPPSPTLVVNPRGVIAGMRTSVSGTGFRPGQAVTLTWRLPDGSEKPACPGATVKVLGNGTLATPCQIPQQDRLGQRVLIADDGARTANANALIISSSMQPSRGDDRFVIRR